MNLCQMLNVCILKMFQELINFLPVKPRKLPEFLICFTISIFISSFLCLIFFQDDIKELLENREQSETLQWNLFFPTIKMISFPLFLFYTCLYRFTQRIFDSTILAPFLFLDRSIFRFFFTPDKLVEKCLQNYFIFPVLYTPILCFQISCTNLSPIFAIMSSLTLIVTILPVKSSAPTMIPVCYFIYTLFTYFIYTSPSNYFQKQVCKYLPFFSEAIIFVLVSKYITNFLKDIYDNISDGCIKNFFEEVESLKEYPVDQTKMLKRFGKIFNGKFYDNSVMFLFLAFLQIIFPGKKTSNFYYMQQFFWISLIIIFLPSNQTTLNTDHFQFAQESDSQFFVSKIYFILSSCLNFSSNSLSKLLLCTVIIYISSCIYLLILNKF